MSSPSDGHRSTQPDGGLDHQSLVATLRAAGCVFAEEEADLLLAAGGDVAPLLRRRVAGEPLEHVLGRVGFAGLELRVDPGLFVPRQRTVHLAEVAARRAGRLPRPVVVDLCCGVGAVGAVVAHRVPRARLLAADLDPAAVSCARTNLPGAEVSCGDLFDALPADLRSRVDVLACNAPYVPTAQIAAMPPEARRHEPGRALDGGADGLDVHRRVAAQAHRWLAPGGALLIEVAEPQLAAARGLLRDGGLAPRVDRDDERGATVLIGRFER